MLPVDYLPAARHDFDQSFDWYAARSAQAAIRFANAVDAALAIIAAHPERFPAIDEAHRECLVARYPFRVVYRLTENRILIVAVAHAKRRPDYWKDRT